MIEEVTTRSEKLRLLGDMVRLQYQWSASSFQWAERLTSWLVDMPTVWSLQKLDGPLREEFADAWQHRFGPWSHGGGTTVEHNRLGMAYAWLVLQEAKLYTEIELGDSPDFCGTMTCPIGKEGKPKRINIVGDIGQCSPIAVTQGIRKLTDIHDTWVSILDWNTIVVIEFDYNPAYWHWFNVDYQLDQLSNADTLGEIQHHIRKVFFCDHCNEWTISDDFREKLLSTYKS